MIIGANLLKCIEEEADFESNDNVFCQFDVKHSYCFNMVLPPGLNYWFSFTLAYSTISHEYSSLFIIVIILIFMFLL